jgi:hypothetical protein
VVINDTIAQFAVPLLPFGGIKQSGSGRTHGREGLMQFTRPYSYVVGQPPIAWDVATIGRQPGHYGFLSAIAHLVFGVTPQQRIRPVIAGAQRLKLSPARRSVAIGAGAVVAALGALVGLGFASKRAKPHW